MLRHMRSCSSARTRRASPGPPKPRDTPDVLGILLDNRGGPWGPPDDRGPRCRRSALERRTLREELSALQLIRPAAGEGVEDQVAPGVLFMSNPRPDSRDAGPGHARGARSALGRTAGEGI